MKNYGCIEMMNSLFMLIKEGFGLSFHVWTLDWKNHGIYASSVKNNKTEKFSGPIGMAINDKS